ncbi:hypothetical protein D3C71_2126500 [compost metagenome]
MAIKIRMAMLLSLRNTTLKITVGVSSTLVWFLKDLPIRRLTIIKFIFLTVGETAILKL